MRSHHDFTLRARAGLGSLWRGARSALPIFLPLLALLASSLPAAAAPVRLKDLVEIQGVRENELFGYGLVVGLAGTGDTERVFFTSQSIAGMLGRLGIRVDPREVRVRNVAAVMVTARLPAFSRSGTRIDVTVSSMGNARSLTGGVLLITPLTGADGVVHAVAQGPVQVGGYAAGAAGSLVSKNSATSGRIPQGATVEKAVTVDLSAGPLVLNLREPDFTTARRIAEAVDGELGPQVAKTLDPAAVQLTLPAELAGDPVAAIARIEGLVVDADVRAKVVVSERTGTVVAGADVRIRPVAVAHGGLQVSIASTPVVSQPNALATGNTVAARQASVLADETRNPVVALPATATVQQLVAALNQLGASPRDLVSILQAIKAAGALDAELEVL